MTPLAVVRLVVTGLWLGQLVYALLTIARVTRQGRADLGALLVAVQVAILCAVLWMWST